MISNTFTPVADNLPPAVMRSAESAAGGSDLPVPVQDKPNRQGRECAPALIGEAQEKHKRSRVGGCPVAPEKEATLAAGNSFSIPHICISCGQTLRAKQDASRVVVYCGYGPCKSKAANEGAFGRTVDEAVDELNARILEEEV